MNTGPTLNHLYRSHVGNVKDVGAFACAAAVMERCRRAREKNGGSINVLVSDDGDVYAPYAGTHLAEFAIRVRPRWLAGTYRAPLATAKDIATDIRCHLVDPRGSKTAA
jgi:hypothetical protein